jgi:hypothetical protein
MSRFARVALASALLAATGCGGTPGPGAIAAYRDEGDKFALGQVSKILEAWNGGSPGKAPAKLADFAKFQNDFPVGYGMLKDGEVVFFYGAPVQAGASDTVLAYRRSTPESGGLVLMQDGSTIKRMTPEEFNSAQKVGKPPAAATAKQR